MISSFRIMTCDRFKAGQNASISRLALRLGVLDSHYQTEPQPVEVADAARAALVSRHDRLLGQRTPSHKALHPCEAPKWRLADRPYSIPPTRSSMSASRASISARGSQWPLTITPATLPEWAMSASGLPSSSTRSAIRPSATTPHSPVS